MIGYSKLVKSLKIILPSIAVLFFLALVLWPDRHQKIKTDSPQATEEAERLHLSGARFYTSDKKSQPVSITAERAEETAAGSQIVRLNNVQADIQLQDKTFISAHTAKAVYNREKNILQTETPVEIKTDNGYTMTIHRANFNLDQRTLIGLLGKGFGPMGEGEAIDILYQDKRQRLTLKKNPKIVVNHANRKMVISADQIIFFLATDEIDAKGGVKMTINDAEFTADRTKIRHGVSEKKRTVKHIESGSRVVFKTVSQTISGDTLVFKEDMDLAIIKGNPVIMTMEGLEMRTSEIHYSPTSRIISAVGDVHVRRTDGTTMTGDLMKIYTGTDHQPEKMEAIGNIVVTTADEVLKADFVVYYFDTQVVKAEHNIVLIRGQNQVKGDFATIDLQHKISRIEMTEQPVDVLLDPTDKTLKDTGQSVIKDVKEVEEQMHQQQPLQTQDPD